MSILICWVFNSGFVIFIFVVIKLLIGYKKMFFFGKRCKRFLYIFWVWYKLWVIINKGYFLFLFKSVINIDWVELEIFVINCFFKFFFKLLIIVLIFLFFLNCCLIFCKGIFFFYDMFKLNRKMFWFEIKVFYCINVLYWW